ncbi:MAG: hypothetical protein ACJ76N_23360 [Thermoanaerobaculia bacterium]
MEEPFLYKGNEPITWSLSQIVELTQDLTSLGCLDELVKEADRAGISVQVPAEAINFVKRFLFKGGYHKNSGKALDVIRSAACIPAPLPPGGPPVFPPPGPGDPPPFTKEPKG